ncbi:hypothetical protein [Sphingobium sp. YR768]|uniref:hypothetical protein n=1 Tax=Sphingobium sp. YR768 TaxID=1884365 RepID=UPI000B87A8CA|nr:hypothetical protein [Sphingobium sp. YR768]
MALHPLALHDQPCWRRVAPPVAITNRLGPVLDQLLGKAADGIGRIDRPDGNQDLRQIARVIKDMLGFVGVEAGQA